MKTKILDCTLRDGGYYTNWDFDDQIVKNYIKYTNDLNIDYIEIGYRNLKNQNEYKGQFYYLPSKTLRYFKKNSNHKIALMIDFKSVPINSLEQLLSDCINYVDLVRIAVSPSNLSKCQKHINEINKMGFKVALNIMQLSKWEINKIKKEISKLKNLEYLYLVDSYGAILPDQLEENINEINKATSINLGFHSHDNIELAFSNTLTAIKNNISIIDSTILGMGRGAGNLKTELILLMNLSIASNINNSKEYDSLSNLTELFLPLKERYNWGSDLSYKFAGINSYPQKEIMSLKISKNYNFSQIRDHFDKGVKSNIKLNSVTKSFKKNNLDTIIIGGGESLELHKSAINTFFEENLNKYNFIFSSIKSSELVNPKMKYVFNVIIGSDYEKILNSSSKNISYILPNQINMNINDSNKLINTYSLDYINDRKEKLNHLESCLALVGKISKSNKIFMLGFDGFTSKSKFFNVFKQNEKILDHFKHQFKIKSLTQTMYSVDKDSIYSYI